MHKKNQQKSLDILTREELKLKLQNCRSSYTP